MFSIGDVMVGVWCQEFVCYLLVVVIVSLVYYGCSSWVIGYMFFLEWIKVIIFYIDFNRKGQKNIVIYEICYEDKLIICLFFNNVFKFSWFQDSFYVFDFYLQ